MTDMIEAVAVTILPVGFLIVLFGGGALFLRKKIEQDGKAPINRTSFYASKYSIVAIWGAMVIQSWGIRISVTGVPRFLQIIALLIWVSGFRRRAYLPDEPHRPAGPGPPQGSR
jgi:hypothetical protein